jgi:hypothetical protein
MKVIYYPDLSLGEKSCIIAVQESELVPEQICSQWSEEFMPLS